MGVVLHPMDQDATIVLGPSEGGLGGQHAPDGFPASGRNAYPSRANTFCADVSRLSFPSCSINLNIRCFTIQKKQLGIYCTCSRGSCRV